MHDIGALRGRLSRRQRDNDCDGVDIDETAAARFPYSRSYLPVCRLGDGTVWNY
jgi:hypothetical protein